MKYKVGQEVKYVGEDGMFQGKGELYTITGVGTGVNENGYDLVDKDGEFSWSFEADLVSTGKRLEYGFCEVGDIFVDEDGKETMVLDTREKIVFMSAMDAFDFSDKAMTYEEVAMGGFKYKEPKEDNTACKNCGEDHTELVLGVDEMLQELFEDDDDDDFPQLDITSEHLNRIILDKILDDMDEGAKQGFAVFLKRIVGYLEK